MGQAEGRQQDRQAQYPKRIGKNVEPIDHGVNPFN
jgi:hypothetical protein